MGEKSKKEIWVYTEHRNGELSKLSAEVLSEGRRLADRFGGELVSVLVGYHLEGLAEGIGKRGVDRILAFENPALENYALLPYSKLLAQLIEQRQPHLVLFGATLETNKLASRLAARMKAGLVTDCTLLGVSNNNVVEATKPAYGGRVSATFRLARDRLQLLTVSQGSTEIAAAAQKPNVERVCIEETGGSIIQSVGFLKGDPQTVDLREAERIVAGGRGLGSPEGVDLLEELAELLGASVGGTRVAVDNQWLPFERQIGQTGKVTSPRFFMTWGTSGAIHYTMGFKEAEFIMAIDQNPRAPIFELADTGVVADVGRLLPALVELLREEYQPDYQMGSE